MTIATIGSSPNTLTQTSKATLGQDYEKFISLLVAQVQNQDPLSPMDGTEFVSQLAQLTQVEQAVRTNDTLDQLNTTLEINSALSQSFLVGREVTTLSETFTLGESGGSFSYEMEGSPSAVTAVITDAGGRTVRQIAGLSTQSGVVVDVAWDGLDDSGNPMPAGEYGVSLVTPEGAGAYNTYATATVDSIEYAGGLPMMRLSDGRYASSNDIVRTR